MSASALRFTSVPTLSSKLAAQAEREILFYMDPRNEGLWAAHLRPSRELPCPEGTWTREGVEKLIDSAVEEAFQTKASWKFHFGTPWKDYHYGWNLRREGKEAALINPTFRVGLDGSILQDGGNPRLEGGQDMVALAARYSGWIREGAKLPALRRAMRKWPIMMWDLHQKEPVPGKANLALQKTRAVAARILAQTGVAPSWRGVINGVTLTGNPRKAGVVAAASSLQTGTYVSGFKRAREILARLLRTSSSRLEMIDGVWTWRQGRAVKIGPLKIEKMFLLAGDSYDYSRREPGYLVTHPRGWTFHVSLDRLYPWITRDGEHVRLTDEEAAAHWATEAFARRRRALLAVRKAA